MTGRSLALRLSSRPSSGVAEQSEGRLGNAVKLFRGPGWMKQFEAPTKPFSPFGNDTLKQIRPGRDLTTGSGHVGNPQPFLSRLLPHPLE
jgi:hypothetical protein